MPRPITKIITALFIIAGTPAAAASFEAVERMMFPDVVERFSALLLQLAGA